MENSRVFRLDYKCAQVVRRAEKADKLPPPAPEFARCFTPEATSSKMIVRGLADFVSGGRGQSAYDQSSKNNINKIRKGLKALCFTTDSCIRVTRDFIPVHGVSLEAKTMMSSSTNSYVKSSGTGNVNVTHERYVEDMEVTVIKGDVVNRFKTVKTGTNTKTLRIEQENMKEAYVSEKE